MRDPYRKKSDGFRRARSALHRHRRPKSVPVRTVRRSVDQESKQPDLRTIHPNREKLRDLRRIARSAQRPRIYDLFDVYHPEYKKYDQSRDRLDWHIHWDAQHDWVAQVAGGCQGGWGGVPSSFRRDRNRQLRNRQKAALNRAFRADDWGDFSLPRGRNDIAWLYW